jgi:hypothetical protein
MLPAWRSRRSWLLMTRRLPAVVPAVLLLLLLLWTGLVGAL